MSNNDSSKNNNMQTVWLVVGVLVITVIIALGLMKMSSSTEEPQVNNNSAGLSRLSAEQSFYDFGTISMKDGNVNKIFTIENNTPKPITIDKIYTSCMCTTAELITDKKSFGPFGMPGHGYSLKINQEIQPGEKAEIEAIYDPNAHGPAGIGKINRQIFIETSDGQKLTIEFNANVTP